MSLAFLTAKVHISASLGNVYTCLGPKKFIHCLFSCGSSTEIWHRHRPPYTDKAPQVLVMYYIWQNFFSFLTSPGLSTMHVQLYHMNMLMPCVCLE